MLPWPSSLLHTCLNKTSTLQFNCFDHGVYASLPKISSTSVPFPTQSLSSIARLVTCAQSSISGGEDGKPTSQRISFHFVSGPPRPRRYLPFFPSLYSRLAILLAISAALAPQATTPADISTDLATISFRSYIITTIIRPQAQNDPPSSIVAPKKNRRLRPTLDPRFQPSRALSLFSFFSPPR